MQLICVEWGPGGGVVPHLPGVDGATRTRRFVTGHRDLEAHQLEVRSLDEALYTQDFERNNQKTIQHRS